MVEVLQTARHEQTAVFKEFLKPIMSKFMSFSNSWLIIWCLDEQYPINQVYSKILNKVDIAIRIHFWWLNCFKLFIANTTFRGTILKYNGCIPDKEKIHTFYLQQVYRGSKFGLQCQIIIKDRLDKDQYEYSTS